VKLNHLDLQVSDVQRSVVLFEQLFGLQLQSSRTSPALAILTDGEGFTLVLQRRKNDAEQYPEGFHCGFLVDDVETVRAFHARAVGHEGLEVSEIIENNRGVMVYVRTWDGVLIEVAWHRVRWGMAASPG
jgi:catechol 2,3-dioxygenase-like lactoylglutathione lyase family enzyme